MMKTEIIEAKTAKDAMDRCPWAVVVAPIDSGGDAKLWMCFESQSEHDTWES